MPQVICVECNATVSDDGDFCSECGFPFASLQPVKCPECGNNVVFSTDACPVCGLPYEKLIERLAPESPVIPVEAELSPEPVTVPPESDPALSDEPAVAAEEPVADESTEDVTETVGDSDGDPEADVAPSDAAPAEAEDEPPVDQDLADDAEPEVAPAEEGDDEAHEAPSFEAVDAVEVTTEEMAALSAVIAAKQEPETAEIADAEAEAEVEVAPTVDEMTVVVAPHSAAEDIVTEAPVAIGGDLGTQLDELHAEVLRLSAMVTNSEKLVAGLIDRVAAQHEEAVSRDLLSAVASELGGATARLEAGQKTLAADVAAQLGKLKSGGADEGKSAPEKPGEMVDYLFYLALAILLFTVLNTFITAYLVRVVK